MRTAVALPVRIDIKDCYDATCTELTVTANIGGRGHVFLMSCGFVPVLQRRAAVGMPSDCSCKALPCWVRRAFKVPGHCASAPTCAFRQRRAWATARDV